MTALGGLTSGAVYYVITLSSSSYLTNLDTKIQLASSYANAINSSGRIVGLAHYLFHRSTTQLAPVCYLQDLFTVEESRGKGVGRALIEAVYERAREAGAKRVYWQTHETNATAMRLYGQVAERSGFIVYRREV